MQRGGRRRQGGEHGIHGGLWWGTQLVLFPDRPGLAPACGEIKPVLLGIISRAGVVFQKDFGRNSENFLES